MERRIMILSLPEAITMAKKNQNHFYLPNEEMSRKVLFGNPGVDGPKARKS